MEHNEGINPKNKAQRTRWQGWASDGFAGWCRTGSEAPARQAQTAGPGASLQRIESTTDRALATQCTHKCCKCRAHSLHTYHDRGGKLEPVTTVLDHAGPTHEQRTVGELRSWWLGVHAVSRHLRMLHEHLLTWDAHVVEPNPPVVDAVATHFGAAVADGDATHGRVRLHVSQLDDEHVDASVGAANDESSVHGCVRGSLTGGTDPPLGAGDGGAVDVELLRIGHVRSRGLEAAQE